MAFTARLLRPFEVRTTLKMTPPASMERLRQGALQLARPETAGMVLRAAAAETLMKAYRERFLQALPGMVNMQRETFRRKNPMIPMKLRKDFLAAFAKYEQARMGTDGNALKTARLELNQLRNEVRNAVKPGRPARHPLPSTGLFRKLAMQVLGLVADASEAKIFMQGAQVVLGIGNLAALERIRTPSATPQLTGNPTSSTRNVLWKQLEFGTGAFSTRKDLQGPKHRLPGGGWWYGREQSEALQLRGSRPGKFLQDPARRLPYEKDSVRFHSVLNAMLTKVLRG